MPTAYGYGRASLHREELTLSGQRDVTEAWFMLKSATTPGLTWGGFVADAAATQTVDMFMRPVAEKLMMKMKAKDIFVVASASRAFRSFINLSKFTSQFRERKIDLVLFDLEIDTTTEIGRRILLAVTSVSMMESTAVSRDTKEAMASKWNEAKWSRYAPIGWMSGSNNSHILDELEPNLKEREIYNKLKELYIETK